MSYSSIDKFSANHSCAAWAAGSRRFTVLLALAGAAIALVFQVDQVKAADSPDPCALVTQAEAAAALGTPVKAAERGQFLPSCTYRAEVPAGDPRSADMVFIRLQDDSLFQLPKNSKAFQTEPVSVADEAYYSWSGRIDISGPSLSLRKRGTFVLINLSAYHGNARDPKSITIAEIKGRELTLARHAVGRLP